MKRVLLICLSLVLALVGGSAACAEDGFYVIAGGGKSASVPKTGQTASYDQNTPPKDDGALKKGVAWPTPRFTDNNNGTVTDNLTNLIWMKHANYSSTQSWQAPRPRSSVLTRLLPKASNGKSAVSIGPGPNGPLIRL